MCRKFILPALFCLLFCGSAHSQAPTVKAVSATSPGDGFRIALSLYESGMYERAREVFSSLGDPLSGSYAILCAAMTGDPSAGELEKEYEALYPKSILYNDIHYRLALNLFSDRRHEEALKEFLLVDPDALQPSLLAEFHYKKGYSAFGAGDFATARTSLSEVLSLPRGSFTVPSSYTLGYMDYLEKNFGSAQQYLSAALSDDRFRDLADYYILESRFMTGDYAYVLEKGEAMYGSIPAERKSRLARIISESYLVTGNKEKALEYFRMEGPASELSQRSDLFHAGSVLYASGDYEGAIRNFSRMDPVNDSIGQIASYQLGYSYISVKNKVAALSSFKDASSLDFSDDIKEDAFFNYAKLAFDLNDDTSVFDAYLKTWSTSRKGEQIYDYVAKASLSRREYEKAIDAYSNIDELGSGQKANYAKANYLRASQLVSVFSYTDAIPYLKAASLSCPRGSRFYQISRYALAECYYRTGAYDVAAGIYNELYNVSALDGMTEGALLSYNLAHCHYALKKYDQAARWFDVYIASKDGQFREDAMTRRADCDFARRNYKGAVRFYQNQLEEFFSPDKVYPYFQQALALGLSGDAAMKVEVLSSVMDARPDVPLYNEAMYELGRSYMETDRNKEALSVFDILESTTSDNTFVARALIGQGMACRNMSRHGEALAYYKRVVSLMPGSEYAEDALLAINSIYRTTGHPEKYLEYLEENRISAGKTEAEKEAVYFNTAEQVYLSGNFSAAVKSLQKYLDSYPEGSRKGDAYFYIAESLRKLGRREEACSYYSLARENSAGGSFAETAALSYADLSFELERFGDAYKGYSVLKETAVFEQNRIVALVGMMRSAYRDRNYQDAVKSADEYKAAGRSDKSLEREADYIKAKSLLASSRRGEAMAVFSSLASQPSTAEGAEASYVLIQDAFDNGDFSRVETLVYDFAQKAGNQSYWLARSFIVLGDAFREKGQLRQAEATYRSIADGYVPENGTDDVLEAVKERLASVETKN